MTETVTGPNDQGMSEGDSSGGAAAPQQLPGSSSAAGPLNAIDLATMFGTLDSSIPDAASWSISYGAARRLRAFLRHLEDLVHVPGQWRCAKCRFVLQRTTIDMARGQIGVSESDRNRPEPCPNGCGPLWRVSERDAGNEAIDRYIKENEALSKLLGGIAYCHIHDAVQQLVKASIPGTEPMCKRCRRCVPASGKVFTLMGNVVECPSADCPTRRTS